jgi:hypothetical protein
MYWAENRIYDLLAEEVAHKLAYDSAEKKLHDIAAQLEKRDEQIAELLNHKIIQNQAVQQEKVEKEQWVNDKLAILAKSVQELDEMQSTATRPKGGLKVEPALFDAIDSLGKATERARREMSNLVAGKNKPEQAFGKWEKTYCKPSLDLVHLASLVRREETTKYRKDCESRARARHNQELQEKQQIFAKEQYEWRIQKAKELNGKELRAVEKEWKKTHEQTFRIHIWEEAKQANMAAAEDSLKTKHAVDCVIYYERSWEAGREDGLKQSRTNSLIEFQKQLAEAQAIGYNAGIAVETRAQRGLEQQAWELIAQPRALTRNLVARAKAQEKFEKARDEAFYRGLHWGAQMPTWVDDDELLKADGTANMFHRYWWGRA